MKKLGLLAVVGSIGIMVLVSFSAYQFGQQVAYDECLTTMRAMNAKLIEYAVADSLRQCFEARPSLIPRKPKDTTWEVVGSFIKPTLPDSLVGETWNKYSGGGGSTGNSGIGGSIPIIGVDTNVWQRKLNPHEIVPNQISRPRSTLYTDSGDNHTALPFLFTGDSSVIMLTTVDDSLTHWRYLRVLEWVQRPTCDTVITYCRQDLNGRSLPCYDIRYRWSARVEGM